MDFKILKSFLAICETGNITRAAEALFISQPALTRQIKDLESELQCKLFDRNTRSLSLTKKGWQFQKRAKELLALEKLVQKEMAEEPGMLHGVVRIGCVESSAMALLAKKIKAFSKTHPGVQFQVHSADGDDLRTFLDAEALDMAIFIEPVETAKYTRIPLHVKERWGLIVKANDPLATKASISPQELSKLPLMLPRRFIVIDEIKSWLKMQDDNLNIVGFINLLSNGLDLVREGIGKLVAIEGAFTNRPNDDFKFIPIESTSYIEHVVGRKRNRTLENAAELFWSEFKDEDSG